MSVHNSPHSIQREMGVCTECGKTGPIFLRYKERKLCDDCTPKRSANLARVNLRDHPLMTRKSGYVNWPPQWRPVEPNRSGAEGEIGVLEDASMHVLITNKIFVSMVHLKERYIAVLAFDDEMFAKQLYSILAQNIGRAIREIGELDASHLL